MAHVDNLSIRRFSERGKQSNNVGFEGRSGTFGAPIRWVIKALLNINQKKGCLRPSLGHGVLVASRPLLIGSNERD